MRDSRSLPSKYFLNTQEVATLLGVNPATLKWWRVRAHRAGPDFIKMGNLVRYSLADLMGWIDSRKVRIYKETRGK